MAVSQILEKEVELRADYITLLDRLLGFDGARSFRGLVLDGYLRDARLRQTELSHEIRTFPKRFPDVDE